MAATTTNPFGGRSRISVDSLGDPEPPGLVVHQHQPLITSIFDKGILRDTLLPSVTLQSGLAVIAFGAGRYANRADTKDLVGPAGQVLGAWWAAAGTRLAAGIPARVVLSTLSRPERLLLAGVTLWGGRRLLRLATQPRTRTRTRAAAADGEKEDDPAFWETALGSVFLRAALFQTVISLPFTAPFNHQGAVLTGYHPTLQAIAVGLFGAGFALEALADWQLDSYGKQNEIASTAQPRPELREGVWSVVQRPRDLGDMLVHISFPFLLYASDMLAPIELLGPIANYFFLRSPRGDQGGTENAQYSASLLPDTNQLSNQWTWIVAGCGVATVLLERAVHKLL